MSILWLKLGCTVKYSLSPREIPRKIPGALPSKFPLCSRAFWQLRRRYVIKVKMSLVSYLHLYFRAYCWNWSLRRHYHSKERVLKKTANYPDFVDKRLTPPPFSTLAEVNNIHPKEFFIPISLPPPPLPSALIHFYQC